MTTPAQQYTDFYSRNKAYYDRNANRYERTSWYLFNRYKLNSVRREIKKCFSLFPDKTRIKILEIGPGTGYLLNILREIYKNDIDYTGIEHSSKMVSVLKKRFKGLLYSLSILQESVTPTLIDNLKSVGPFDFIIGSSILHHLPNYDDIIERLTEILASGGAMYFVREPLHRDECIPSSPIQDFFEPIYSSISSFFLKPIIQQKLWPKKIKAEDASLIAYHMYHDGVSTKVFSNLEKKGFSVVFFRKYNRRMTSFFSYLENQWLKYIRKDIFGNTLFSICLQNNCNSQPLIHSQHMELSSKKEIEDKMLRIIEQYQEWTYDIPLPFGLWTKGDLRLPHTRLKRVVQAIHDTVKKPLKNCTILDLGCLDGIYSIELALQGAYVKGVDAREVNIIKANFSKECLKLDNLEFIQDDVRNVNKNKYGMHDAIICSGILYHLDSPDIFLLLEHIYEMVNRVVIIDSHVSIKPNVSVFYKGHEYHGHIYTEHMPSENDEIKQKRLLSSFGNDKSFWLTRPSLINALSMVGFSSIYECFNPVHLNFGNLGIEHADRCTFVAIKNEKVKILTSPEANFLEERWPEGSLSYK